MRILVAESDADNRDSLGLLLQERGHEVHLAETGEQALASARAVYPDLVVLDLGLPDMAFERVVSALKAMPWRPVVVAYTGFAGREADARAAGCDAFVLKPSLDPLIATVETLGSERAGAQTGSAG